MAAEEINNAGGIRLEDGVYKIKLVVEDTEEMNPSIPTEKGVEAFKRLIEVDGAKIILGGVRTDIVVAQSQLLSSYKIVFIDIESNNPWVEMKVAQDYPHYKYYFHLFANGSVFKPYMVLFPMALRSFSKTHPEYPNMSRMAILAENALWTVKIVGRPVGNSSYVKALQTKFGFDIPYMDLYPTTEADFSSYLAKAKAAGVGQILFLFSGAPGVAFVKQWQDYDWSPYKKPIVWGPGLLGGFSWFWDQTTGKAQSSIWWPASIRLPKDWPIQKTAEFYDRFKAKYHDTPNTAAYDIYDGMYILKIALEKAGTWNADKLVKALEQTDYEGVIGPIKFTRFHGLEFAEPKIYWYFGQWQNGKLVDVWSAGNPKVVYNLVMP